MLFWAHFSSCMFIPYLSVGTSYLLKNDGSRCHLKPVYCRATSSVNGNGEIDCEIYVKSPLGPTHKV